MVFFLSSESVDLINLKNPLNLPVYLNGITSEMYTLMYSTSSRKITTQKISSSRWLYRRKKIIFAS